MPLKRKDKEYRYIRGSDVVRDGMYIEVSDQQNEAEAIIEIFYSDVSHEMSVTLFKPDVPLELIEWAISVARKRLPVKLDEHD
ncbi:MAG: hypothetical protein AAFW83_09445 [Pseudomonadota bacterium]